MMAPTHTRFGIMGVGWPSKRLGAARTAECESVVWGQNEPKASQGVSFEHAPDALAAHGVAVGLHFDSQPGRAIALGVIGKCFAHRHLPSRLDASTCWRRC